MSEKEIKEAANTYFYPYLLGSNKLSASLASKLWWKYRLSPIIIDKKHSAFDMMSLTGKFVRRSEATDSEIVAQELIALAGNIPYVMPILVPCSDEYEKIVLEQQEILEAVFIIRSADKLFTDPPLAHIL